MWCNVPIYLSMSQSNPNIIGIGVCPHPYVYSVSLTPIANKGAV